MSLHLSPLNFRGLLHTLGMVIPGSDAGMRSDEVKPERRRRPIECWRCPECLDVHDWESDAEECCAPKLSLHHEEAAQQCPVCAAEHQSHRDAADCCLWKDLGAHARWAVADAVKRGATWAEALGITRKE